MKIVGLRDAKQALSACVDDAQRGDVLITRHGRPAAVLLGVEGSSMEQVVLGMDEAVFRMIDERRRASDAVPADEARRALGLPRGSARGTVRSR